MGGRSDTGYLVFDYWYHELIHDVLAPAAFFTFFNVTKISSMQNYDFSEHFKSKLT